VNAPAVTAAALTRYARARLGPGQASDRYTFRLFGCATCGAQPLALTVTPHTGARARDFRGEIHGQCAACAAVTRVFSFTGQQRKPLPSQAVTCGCGHDYFISGELARYDGADLPGFCEETVVVAGCAQCGQKQVVVETD
jgi:hypothetical protein